jgi:hypothetical protein
MGKELAALKAQPAPVQEPLTWLKTIETPGGFGKFVEAKPTEKGAKPVYLTPPAAQPAPEQYSVLEQALTRLQKRYGELEAKVAAQPAVPDAFGTREGEHPQYIEGWNDCRAEMLKGMKP